MQKPSLGKLLRNLLAAGVGLLVLGAGALAFMPAARESLACNESTDLQFSPGGKYRAQLTERTCRWGMGQAPSQTELVIDREDKEGGGAALPLETDAEVERAPTLKWRGANALEVTVYSSALTGTLVRRLDELTVTRRYVKAARRKAGDKGAAS